MITVPQIVEKLIKQSPSFEEGLSANIINLSSLARKIQPQIRQELDKDIQIGAIVMALKRLSVKLQAQPLSLTPPISVNDLTVRSNLVEFTFRNSPTLITKQEKLLQIAGKEHNTFLTFTHGLFETTLIVSASLDKEVLEIFKKEKLILKFTDLATITLILPKASVYQSGVYYQILKRLFSERINVVEAISSLTELTIILESSEVDRAFSVLKNLA